MGWKSTIRISRTEAKRLIVEKMDILAGVSNSELENKVESLGYGDDTNLPYYGHNFIVVDGDDLDGDDDEY